MKKPGFLISLNTDQNDYQHQQAMAAEEIAQRLGVDIQVVFADNDAINQSQQLLSVIQSAGPRPAGIVCQPVGTGLAQVAMAAVSAGIGWAVLNREVDYLAQLRSRYQVPVFGVSVDQEEVGKIQGAQIAALLPDRGLILYIQGPAVNPAVQVRASGMYSTKPAHIQVRALRGRWTEESGYETVTSWLRLSTSHQTPISLVASQNDAMALGARRAFEQHTAGAERDMWTRLPFTGCDACPGKGQEWIRKGVLSASVLIPPTAGLALEMFVRHLQSGTQPPEATLIQPNSYPAIEKLIPVRGSGKASFDRH
jgi:ribose transport system substrate-binding protein